MAPDEGTGGATAPSALPELCDALYALVPAQFTAARDAAAAQARAAGDRPLATAVAALRKPTLAAWLANLLIRSHPDEVDQLLELGAALREAQEHLAGPELRRLLAERHAVVGSLVRSARKAAAETGNPVAESVAWDVEATLTLALTDDAVAAALRSGLLVSTARRDSPDAADVRSAQATLDAAEPASPPPRRATGGGGRRAAAKPPDASPADRDRADDEADQQAEAEADDLARRRLERARAAVADAVQARQERERAAATAAAEHDDARAAVDDAAHAEQVAARQVHAAAAEVTRLEQRLRTAHVGVDDAERALAQARASRVDADDAARQTDEALAAARAAADAARAAEEQARAAVAEAAGGPPPSAGRRVRRT